MARSYKRKEGFLTYAPSTQSRLELSRNYHMQNLLCKLTVTHDNGASPSFNDEDVAALINGVQVVANGNITLKSVPASKFIIDNLMASGRRGFSSINTTADATDATSHVWFMINFSMPGIIRPHDTILNTALFQSFDLLVDWGSSASIGTDITVKDARLDVFSSSLIGYKRNPGETIKNYIESSLKEEITASSNEYTIQLPVNKLYRSISIVAQVDGKRNDDVINSIKIKSGTTTFAEWDAEALRAHNNFNYRIENDEDTKGIYIVDFCERGRLTDLLNTVRDFNTLEVVLNVTKQSGTNFVQVLTDYVEQTGVVEK